MKKGISTTFLLLIIFSIVITGTVVACADDVPSIAAAANIPYIEDGDSAHFINIYGDLSSGELYPVILRVHGGGFFGGTQANNEDYSQYLADQGFIVVSINYTLMPKAGTFQNIEKEIFTALNWVEEHANEYHLDLNRVVMTGDSAGGYLVNLTATIISEEALQEKFEVTAPLYEIKGYVLTCPEVDILELRDDLKTGKGFKNFMATRITEEVLMDDAVEEVDLFTLINPETYPKMYIITSPQDAILYDQAISFDSWLTDKGIDHELHVYDEQENPLKHVFNVSEINWSESIQANEDSVTYMKSLIQ